MEIHVSTAVVAEVLAIHLLVEMVATVVAEQVLFTTHLAVFMQEIMDKITALANQILRQTNQVEMLGNKQEEEAVEVLTTLLTTRVVMVVQEL
jgi:hypothetical protein